jgi:hypothetical protein
MAALITTTAPNNAGFKPGFYLVRESDGQRFFIAPGVNSLALEKVAGKHLSEKVGWGYWIDKCLGMDVAGKPAWLNLDCEDLFF